MSIEMPDGLTAKERAKFLSEQYQSASSDLEAQEILELLNQAMADIKRERAIEKGVIVE